MGEIADKGCSAVGEYSANWWQVQNEGVSTSGLITPTKNPFRGLTLYQAQFKVQPLRGWDDE